MSRELFSSIDAIEEKYIKIWEDVCNIESPSIYKEGVDAVGRYFAERATELGFETEIIPIENAGDVVIISMNSESREKPVVFSGHIDTVHAVGSFDSPAVRIGDGMIYGPGVTDCKGGVVAALMAMEGLKNIGFTSRPVVLMLQTDEETGSKLSGKKTINTICEKAKGCIAFLNLEEQKGNSVVLERKGILRYNVKVFGKAVHSAGCFSGANAVAEAAKKIIKLEEMKNPAGLTCNCGVIHGGTVANTVAEECTFTIDIRFKTQKELEFAMKTVEEICLTVETKGCRCELGEPSIRPAMEYSKENYNLLDRINEINAECGLEALEVKGGMGGSDAAYTTLHSIPTIDSMGVKGNNIHSINENAYLDSLAHSAKQISAIAFYI